MNWIKACTSVHGNKILHREWYDFWLHSPFHYTELLLTFFLHSLYLYISVMHVCKLLCVFVYVFMYVCGYVYWNILNPFQNRFWRHTVQTLEGGFVALSSSRFLTVRHTYTNTNYFYIMQTKHPHIFNITNNNFVVFPYLFSSIHDIIFRVHCTHYPFTHTLFSMKIWCFFCLRCILPVSVFPYIGILRFRIFYG